MSLNKSKALRTAEKYVLQGKIPAAIDEYRKVVEADPADLTTINTLGDLYVRAGRIPDAIQNFSRIAESYRESGFTLKAIAMLKKISKLDPTNIDTAMKLANLYSQQGLLVEARQQYLQVADAYARAGQTRKALEAYQKIADLDPSNTSVRLKLGEIYARERMTDQAHEQFIMAGTEFMRKGDIEQALNANLKALTIDPESRQALTAIATIYTQQGQPDRAINILCDAFEKNPGDVELLTILGRTYLSAGFMDDAERTFLSLVQLDRNRYHYLVEVGRRFLQMGDLDRAAEQIDGCLDVLISKREEDKAIDFLRRILDRDMNHIGSLKRLSQIFMRIREDHNLIATLNSLAEAAMKKGNEKEAVAALKELVRLEPDEPMHRQRLYNFGLSDIAEVDGGDVVRATGPLDYESAAFDDAFVIRQISEAEILAGHGQLDHAVTMLTEILKHTPENVQVHLKLKDIYLRGGLMDKAAAQCMELARIFDARGESLRAADFVAEAGQINPLADFGTRPVTEAKKPDAGWNLSLGEDIHGVGGFEVREATGGLDLSRYRTGPLNDQIGFVTIPDAVDRQTLPVNSPAGQVSGNGAEASGAGAGPAELVFSSAGDLPSDTMARVLRDELEGVDFYIAQGYVEIARDTLERLRTEHGDHSEIIARYKRLGLGIEQRPQVPSVPQPEVPRIIAADAPPVADTGELTFPSEPVEIVQPAAQTPSEIMLEVKETREEESERPEPVVIQKQSGPLADMLVNFNTGDLATDSGLDTLRPATGSLILGETPRAKTDGESTVEPQRIQVSTAHPAERVGTAELIESLVLNLDSSFDAMEAGQPRSLPGSMGSAASQGKDKYTTSGLETGQPATDTAVEGAGPADTELRSMLEELKGNTGDLNQFKDFETHYSLGLAYKDMDLFDEAIEQFQMACRLASLEDPEQNNNQSIQCCNMLGFCFKAKQMPKLAIMWFQRGLGVPSRSDDEYQALRYEIGLCHEELGEIEKATEIFMEVYGIDVNYRHVAEKLKELQALKQA